MPWANGRGTTREIATGSPDTDGNWGWRLSLAAVTEAGSFSPLAGIDRALVVATGNGMRLTINDETTTVGHFQTINFSGDATVHAELIDGPIEDLNFMVRRSANLGTPRFVIVDVGRSTFVVPEVVNSANGIGIIVLDGQLSDSDGLTIDQFDTVTYPRAIELNATPGTTIACAVLNG
jgi:uncharacterized protein